MFELQGLPQVITAIGGLGTAAFGLVDATKIFGGGANHVGFNGIRNAVQSLTPAAPSGTPVNALPPANIVATVQANWINGTDLGSQKSIAKSLVKLNFNAGNAAALAAATGIDPAVLTAIAAKMASGAPLTSIESDVFGRFDLSVTAILDEAYQRSDQVYRNFTRGLAMFIAIGLALVGGNIVHADLATSLLAGVLATPLAPIAKDLSSALATAVNALQAVKK